MVSEQWTAAEVAGHLGIAVESVWRYRSRDASFPEPDGKLGRTPWWRPETIKAWQETRPGRVGRPVNPRVGCTRSHYIDMVAGSYEGGLSDREVRGIAGEMWRLIQEGLDAFTRGEYDGVVVTDDSDYALHPLRLGEAIVELDDGTVWLHAPVSLEVCVDGVQVSGGAAQQFGALRAEIARG